jgi:hypothetical protein
MICPYCARAARSVESLQQHIAAKHRFEPNTYDGIPFPGAEGRWVLRETFASSSHRPKGFGLFVCLSCSRHWKSAHAYRDNFGQDCQGCGQKTFPRLMWQFSSITPHRHRDSLDGPPHDTSRCDACKAGWHCTNARNSSPPQRVAFHPDPVVASPITPRNSSPPQRVAFHPDPVVASPITPRNSSPPQRVAFHPDPVVVSHLTPRTAYLALPSPTADPKKISAPISSDSPQPTSTPTTRACTMQFCCVAFVLMILTINITIYYLSSQDNN